MTDIISEVGVEIQAGTGNVDSSVNRVISDLLKLNTSIKSTSKFTTDLRNNFEKLGVNLDGAKIKSTLQALNSTTTKYNTTSGQTVTVTQRVKGNMDDLKVSVRNVNKEVDKSGSVWKRLTSGFSKVGKELLMVFGISKGAMSLKNVTQSATAYEESLNLFRATMGETYEEAQKWVNMFSKALYINDADLMQYMGSLNSLTKGLGVSADKAYLMSKNLTQLVYDLSSFKNIGIEESFRKIQSAMSGEIEPLRNVGVALSQNTLQELANSLGIKQRVAQMSEAQKAQLRYIQILKSTTEWQGDMARTLISPANALRVLQQQFTLLGRAIGRVFLPIVMKLLPYVMALTQMLTDLANRISAWTGYKIADIDYSSLGDATSLIGDLGDEADETTKKLNTMLAPFDELNVVQSENKKSGKDKSLGGDLGLDLPEYDALAGLTDHLSKQVENAKKQLSDILEIAKYIGIAFASWKIANGIMDFLDKWSLLDAKSLSKTIGLTLIVAGVSLTALGELDIEENLWKGILEKLAGTAMTAGGVYMLTKKVSLALLVTGISLFIQGTIDKKKFNDNIYTILEQQLGIAGIAAGTYMFTKSVTITLLVTLGFELISIGDSLGDLINLEPTAQELGDAIVQMFNDIPITSAIGNWLGETTYYLINEWIPNFFDEFTKNVTDSWNGFWGYWGNVVTESLNGFVDYWSTAFGKIGKKLREWGGNLIDWFKELPGNISDFLVSIPAIVGNVFGIAKDKVFEISGNIIDNILSIPGKLTAGLSNIPNIFGDVFRRARNKVSEIWGNITSLFSKGGNIFNGIVNGISDVFKKIVNGMIKGINSVISSPFTGLNGLLNDIRDFNLPVLGKPFKGLWGKNPIPIPKIPTFAEGGFPKTGEFFMAREAGPEMVGKIGNKTAVANNDQITTSITNALLTAFSGMNFGGGKGTTIVNIGGRKVYEGVGDYVDSENDRYGTNYVHV